MDDQTAPVAEARGKKQKGRRSKKKTGGARRTSGSTAQARYPRHTLEKALRIPRAIIDQNAGRSCTERESASFVGVSFNGPFRVEVSSALKYGLLERPGTGQVAVTDRARMAIRPQKPGDDTSALQEAVLAAPDIADVYSHYRGEYLPDQSFFEHALVDKFGIPAEKVAEFIEIFISSLRFAKLLEENSTDHKLRILDIGSSPSVEAITQPKKATASGRGVATDTCFVVMPFAEPIGGYYKSIYEPAIEKAGLKPVRADADIFGTGKIIDQIWSGINAAKVLVCELTSRNPNVFYELGLAHALRKPVVLVSSNEADVPFDLKHIRVIYYNVTDPFWGTKLIEKVSENILSALKDPAEALFDRALDLKM